MVVSGKLINAKREIKEFNGKKNEKALFYITLAEVDLTEEQIDELNKAFADSGKKFTPNWVLDFKGYVNLKTQFDLPARLMFTEPIQEGSLEDLIADGLKWVGAPVKVSIITKDGALYPKAIQVLGEGEAFNPFSEFDEE